MPCRPQSSEETGSYYITYKAKCQSGANKLVTSCSIPANELAVQADIEKISLENLITGLNGELDSQYVWMADTLKGIGAIIQLKAADVRVDFRVIVKNGTEYQLLHVCPNPVFSQEFADQYFGSFEFVGDLKKLE